MILVVLVFFCYTVGMTLNPLDIMSMNEMFPMTNDFLYIRLQFLLSRSTWLEYNVATNVRSGMYLRCLLQVENLTSNVCITV